MKVTVYITNHNYGKYIKQAIESVLKQDFNSYELLIIDDGSTDDSKEIIEQYRSRPKVKIIYQKKKGLNTSNNIAIRAAKGEFIMRLDADDYLDSNALLIMSNHLDKNPDTAMVFPDYYAIDEEGTVMSVERRHSFETSVTLLDQPAHGACTMIRKDALIEVEGYWEDFQCQDGYDMWLKITKLFKVGNINLPLFYYRQHRKSLSRDELRLYHTRHKMIERSIEERENGGFMNATAVIPMRGDEHGECIELKPFGGSTLIDIKLGEIQKAKRIEKIIVTSPDVRILEHIQKHYYNHNIQLDHRPSSLAALNTYLHDVVTYTMDKYKDSFASTSLIAILHVEAPFLNAFYIDKAVNIFRVFNVDSVIGIRLDEGFYYQHKGNGLVPLVLNNRLRLEKDMLYRQVGGVRLVRKDYFTEHHKIEGGKIGHVLVDEQAGMSVESEFRWEMAEALFKSRNKNHI